MRHQVQLLCVPAGLPKPKGKGKQRDTHLLRESSLLILQAPESGVREALEQEALAAPGALEKGQGHWCYGSRHRQHRAHMCALPG